MKQHEKLILTLHKRSKLFLQSELPIKKIKLEDLSKNDYMILKLLEEKKLKPRKTLLHFLERKLNLKKKNGKEIAIGGNRSEEVFRNDSNIRQKLNTHFSPKIIDRIEKAPSGKKFDNIIYFTDGSSETIQNKKMEKLQHRGHSFDRRPLSKTIDEDKIRNNLDQLSISNRNKMATEQKQDFQLYCRQNSEVIKKFLLQALGNADYWCIIKKNKNNEADIYIIKGSEFKEFLILATDISVKRTCLHLSPYIYLQRKGGGKSDKRADDIQAKLKLSMTLLDQFFKKLV